MSSQGEYYDVKKVGDEWVAMYDPEQHLMGERFKTEKEAWDFVNNDTPKQSEIDNILTAHRKAFADEDYEKLAETKAQIQALIDTAYEQGYDDRSLEADHELEEARDTACVEAEKKGYTKGVIDNSMNKDKLVVEARLNELGQMLGMYLPTDTYIKHRMKTLTNQEKSIDNG